jgi:predicted HAD superfamily Cof-like phosphohydrolase
MLDKLVQNIKDMHAYYGIHEKVKDFDSSKLLSLLQFRIDFLNEELTELENAESADDVVDSLVDLIIVAIGTMDLFEVDIHKAWDAVHTANMSKEVGIKPSRPNPLGLPDLIKPKGWVAPNHEDNVGTLKEIFTNE